MTAHDAARDHDGEAPAALPTDALETDVDVDEVDEEASHEVMNLLSQHVPLALLADLAIPSGPESPQILQDEGLPEVAWWEHEEGDGADGATESPDQPVTT
ncbi:hypothetical protein GXB85_11680 [Cellulomonas sp. APG4]|uniref:hypothetical protein n=1 Tax=Cellulomonas sp. APG4 TaxID=1538656 RepID=UPI0013793CBD|nr:hypothetical protein [Cellulomonas sp. APG4]NCT91607.1 hypothetical protein [Cellulomonas sp. APG4]